ncbi:ATP-binding protein [Bacillus piscicola]|uniref:ATP-binding protein n=1 Tax=Bacillus piscicola TaxID=1632684 RepID=UPI001F0977F4|nr:ATP-binding protein [Bacillus piscicola]
MKTLDQLTTSMIMDSKQEEKEDSSPFKREAISEYVCEGCGCSVVVYKMYIPFGPKKGQWVEKPSPCDCEALAKVKVNQQQAKVNRVQQLFEENSLINSSLKDATFETFEPGEFQSAWEQAKSFVKRFDLNHPENLLFQGTVGTGKSHLSASVTKNLMERGYSAIFISTPKLLTKVRHSYDKKTAYTEVQLLNAISQADIVVFDDIGAEGDITGWGMQKLFEIMDDRAGKHNIFTTNLMSKDFNSTLEMRRIFSRMMMHTTPLIMNGTDYRRRHFKKGHI